MANSNYRILMFAPAFAPFANPEAIVNSKLVLAFLDAGWEIDVISRNYAEESTYNYGSEWVEPWLPLKDITHEVKNGVDKKIPRFLEIAKDALRMRHLIIGCRWAANAFDLALHLHKQNHYHVIMSRSLPDSGHLPALVMAEVVGLPWIANWNDASGIKNPPPIGKGPGARLGFFHERFLNKVARKASWHTFPSERMRLHICQYLACRSERKSSTIAHISLHRHKIEKRKINGMFTISHAGMFDYSRDPEVFFRGLNRFLLGKGLKDNIKLIIIGLDNIELIKLLEKYALESNVNIIGPRSYKDTLEHLKKSDVLLVIEGSYENGIFLPSKFVDYVQVGQPILAVSPINGTLNDIISTYGGGIAVDCNSSQAISNALNELYSQWKNGNLNEKYSSDQLYSLFSPKTIIKDYKKLFKNIGIKLF